MTTINLKEFFYWYKADEYIEVTDEVAEELRADKRYEVTHHRRMKRNKANYSLDADDGIEYAACEFEPSLEKALDLMEQWVRCYKERACRLRTAGSKPSLSRNFIPLWLDDGKVGGKHHHMPADSLQQAGLILNFSLRSHRFRAALEQGEERGLGHSPDSVGIGGLHTLLVEEHPGAQGEDKLLPGVGDHQVDGAVEILHRACM